jgi:hypothetical protein
MLIPIAVACPVLRGFWCLAETVARSSILWDVFRPTLNHKKLICTGVIAMCAFVSLRRAIRWVATTRQYVYAHKNESCNSEDKITTINNAGALSGIVRWQAGFVY